MTPTLTYFPCQDGEEEEEMIDVCRACIELSKIETDNGTGYKDSGSTKHAR